MFLALKDLKNARGRFGLMATATGLITLLLVMLTGLTGGLGAQNTSALEAIGVKDDTRFVFNSEKPSFTDSQFSTDEVLADTIPLGTAQTRLEVDDTAVGVAVLGLPEGELIPGTSVHVPADGIVLPDELSDEVPALKEGSWVTAGGVDVQVAGMADTLHYAHSPVAWTSTKTWAKISHAGKDAAGTVLLGSDGVNPPESMTATDTKGAFEGLEAYKSERSSLTTMQGFLYAISALVTIAFLSVWTVQRTRDMAILRALGATSGYLFKDSLGQAAIVLAVGTALGAVVGAALGFLVQGTVPFELNYLTVVLPAVGIFVLGMAGALLAVRQVKSADPMAILGGTA